MDAEDLKSAGLKVTLPRLKILEVLEKSPNHHLSAEDIYRVLIDQHEEVTFTVTSPNGNLVSVDQISPNSSGDFATDISVGGPLWSQDGAYTVTAQQGTGSAFTDSVEVEVADGLVVPEFGTIAAMILAVAIISIVAISAKSRLSIVPRY